jgi:hypothetical protein
MTLIVMADASFSLEVVVDPDDETGSFRNLPISLRRGRPIKPDPTAPKDNKVHQ